MAKRAATTPGSVTGDYSPFLKAEDVKKGDVLALTGWTRRLNGKYGAQIVIEVTHNRSGKTYDLAIKDGSPSHRKLFKGMGAEPANWKGTITVSTANAGKGHGDYISIDSVNSEDVPF